MSELPAHIRPVSQNPDTRELRFVRETTIKVRWPRRAGIAWEDWERDHGPHIDRLLARSETKVAEVGSVLVGFVSVFPDKLSGKSVVLMLYVKAQFRGDGIGLKLLTGARIRPDVETVHVVMPTASWGQWCARHGIEWERARCL